MNYYWQQYPEVIFFCMTCLVFRIVTEKFSHHSPLVKLRSRLWLGCFKSFSFQKMAKGSLHLSLECLSIQRSMWSIHWQVQGLQNNPKSTPLLSHLSALCLRVDMRCFCWHAVSDFHQMWRMAILVHCFLFLAFNSLTEVSRVGELEFLDLLQFSTLRKTVGFL